MLHGAVPVSFDIDFVTRLFAFKVGGQRHSVGGGRPSLKDINHVDSQEPCGF